jgi:hypothetical protein
MRTRLVVVVVLAMVLLGCSSGPAGRSADNCARDAGPPEVQVCAPVTIHVGVTVAFRLAAYGKVRDDCGALAVDFGDHLSAPTCAIACVVAPSTDRRVARTVEHRYEAPGDYVATFRVLDCGGPIRGAPMQSAGVALTVHVVK